MSPQTKHLLGKLDESNLPSVLAVDENWEVFSALVEWEFSKRSVEAREELIRGLGGDASLLYGNLAIRWVGREVDSIIQQASGLLNRGPREAARVVGHLLGLKPEYCSRTFPVGSGGQPTQTGRVPREDIPKLLMVFDQPFRLQSADYLVDFSGLREQVFCHYVADAREFFLIATRIDDLDGWPALKIGVTPAPAWLYSRVRMARHPGAPVLLCLDMRVAMHFRRLAREAKLLERAGVIVSGCFGGAGAFDALHYKDLAGHPVVIVPGSTREGLKGAEAWAQRCLKEGAASVSVYPWPIIAPGVPVLDDFCPQEPWEKELWGRAVHLDRIELPSKLARDVCHLSIPAADYRRWMASVSLVSVPTEEGNARDFSIEFTRFDNIVDEGRGDVRALTLGVLITHRYTTLIWAPTNVGKSFVAIQLSLALATGGTAFGLPGVFARQVCYLDGEAGEGDFKARCEQLLQENPDGRELVRQNLHVLSRQGLNILEEATGQAIIEQLRKVKAEVLVIDNLLALAPSAAKSNADGLFKFVREVQRAGVAVVIVHHSGKDGTNFKGPSDLASLSQNVMRLEGRDQLASQEDRSAEVDAACRAGGLVVRLLFEKCKAAPQLEGESCTYHLPVNGGWRHIEGFLANAGQTPTPEALNSMSKAMEFPVIPPRNVDMGSLSPDEEKVFNELKKQKSSRSELETRTGLKADKLSGILRKLQDRGLIVKEGNGKATYYRCV